jgi:hypothetical protein
MNIQGPLLLLGMTATTGVGLGTVAVNSGAIDIDDVSGLLADTTNAVSGAVAGAANPFGPAASLNSPQITASGLVPAPDTSLAQVAIDGATDGSITSQDPGTTEASWGTNSGTSHGTSSGSTGGSSGSNSGSNSGNNSGASNGTNSGTSHGTSSGSTGGSYGEDEDNDRDEDEDEEDDRDEDEGDDD